MRRLTLWALTLFSVGLFSFGIGLIMLFVDSHPVNAQDISDIHLEDAEYVGSQECGDCHRALSRTHDQTAHALTLQDVSRDEDLILGDFSQGEDVRMVQFPDEDAPRPFEAKDIAYTIGSGRNIQRYAYEVSRDNYMVLPAQWNVNTQSWEAYTLADEWPNEAYDFGTRCAGCHTTGLDTRRFRWEDDGVQRESCHGPGSVHIDTVDDVGRKPDEEGMKLIRASIVRSPDPQICGQCHSQGSEPSDNLPYPTQYRPGQADLLDPNVFVLVPPDDSAHWYDTGHARQMYMQFNETLMSAHSKSLDDMKASQYADESCLGCHSGDYRWSSTQIPLYDSGDREGIPPDPVTLDTAQFGVTCINCHNPHPAADQETSLITDAYTLCTSCHTNPQQADTIHHPSTEMFEGVTVVSQVEGIPGSHFSNEDGPRCVTCHMPDVPVEMAGERASHLLRPILPGSTEELQDSCTTCHTDFVDVSGMQRLVSDIQTSTKGRLDAARAALTDSSPPVGE